MARAGRRWNRERRVTLAGFGAPGSAPLRRPAARRHFDAAVAAMLDDAPRLAAGGDAQAARDDQEKVAARMGVSVARVSQIEAETSLPRTC